MAARRVRGPDVREWLIRERWLPPRRGAEAGMPSAVRPRLSPLDLLVGLVALPVYAARALIALPPALFQALFLPPRIEAVHRGPPYSKLTWLAADRQVGPRVIDQIAGAIERGDRRILVEGATFLGFSSRP